MRFGISTHLYHEERLSERHLAEMAEFGFEWVELFATRSHFDYHDPDAIGRLESWLRATGVRLHGIHAPVTTSLKDGKWGPAFSTASPDPAERALAVREADVALNIARRIGASVLVVHLGVPDGGRPRPDNSREHARRSIEEIHELAAPLGVTVALEVIPNQLSTPESLVRLLEQDLDLPDAGICLDFGHTFLQGDVVDGIELISGHLVTTHVHDNHGTSDDHLVPFDGGIDWPAALTAVQKVGYEGIFLMELGRTGAPAAVLERGRRARRQFERTLAG